MRKNKKTKKKLSAIFCIFFVILAIFLIYEKNNRNPKLNESQNFYNVVGDEKTFQENDEIHIKKENNETEANKEKNENEIKNKDNIINEDNSNNNINNNQEKQNIVQIKENLYEDKKTPENIKYIELTNEEKISSSLVLGEFNNGKELSSEQYLQVAYNILNSLYNDANKEKYSVEEINSLVYSIFNVKLKQNSSVNGLEFTNGEYIFEKSNREKIELKNVQSDVAAGTRYIEFETNNKKYIAKLGTNTITGETYIISITQN